MTLKKSVVAAIIAIASVVLISFTYDSGDPTPIEAAQSNFEDFPPIPKQFWVQKLPAALSDGNNMILRVHFAADEPLPATIHYFTQVGDQAVAFHDDGATPDLEGSDGIYAAYVQTDIGKFVKDIQRRESLIHAQGGVTHFTGYAGDFINESDLTFFDFEKFDAQQQVPLGAYIIDPADCANDIKKQNSLFVTALSVTEDGARTYKVADNTVPPVFTPTPVTGIDPVQYNHSGNPVGVWTFGEMIRNIVNQNASGVTPREFLKNWVAGWMDGRQVPLNGDVIDIAPRKDAFGFLIGPWLEKANGWNNHHYYKKDITTNRYQYDNALVDQWKDDWDNTPEADLLKNAPFKLMAIVNRIDLRGNISYGTSINNSGETRFIYTLIAPLTYIAPGCSDNADFIINAGTVPTQMRGFSGGKAGVADWQGMNVILEYANPQKNKCDLQDFARQWLDLSSYTIEDNTADANYNHDLEQITNQVTTAGLSNSNKNKSCLARLRTNERIFDERTSLSPGGLQTWVADDWELSQFELGTSGLLEPKPVANTPQLDANNIYPDPGAPTHGNNLVFSAGGSALNGSAAGFTPDGSAGAALLNWMYLNKTRLAAGNHLLPAHYSVPSTTPNNGTYQVFTAATALVSGEQVHFWDMFWDAADLPNYPALNTPAAQNEARNLRRQLSLNTCQGCHAGENKTIFTQVRPVGYGQSLDYWSATPAYDLAPLDPRFAGNVGRTYKNNGSSAEDVYPLFKDPSTFDPNVDVTSPQYLVRVSAFITGRTYHGNGNFGDDNTSDANDGILGNGLFYVFDPGNYKTGPNPNDDETHPKPEGWTGYNDLERRKSDLCNFVTNDCRIKLGSHQIDILQAVIDLTRIPPIQM